MAADIADTEYLIERRTGLVHVKERADSGRKPRNADESVRRASRIHVEADLVGVARSARDARDLRLRRVREVRIGEAIGQRKREALVHRGAMITDDGAGIINPKKLGEVIPGKRYGLDIIGEVRGQ